ncbi:hypothetical protein GCM10027613_07000 [Microlunatus endophyticus]
MITEFQRDRGPPDHRFLRPVVAEVLHPPTPRLGGLPECRLRIQGMVAMDPAPRQNKIKTLALLEIVRVVQPCQVPVGPQV